jgi:DNA-binding transcriptional MerR regulator
MSRKLYTTSEVAKAAGVPLATLQAWITTGVIAAPPVQGRGAGVRLWTDAQMRQIRKMRKFRQSPAFLKDRSERQSATMKETLAPKEARERMRTAAAEAWTPERHEEASAAITASWAKEGVRRKRITGIKKAWTPERREAQAAATAKIMADPALNERRLAGLRRANADPELNALRIANLKKANADPDVRRRKIEKMKRTLHTPEVNARRSARLKKMWDKIRADRALAELAKPPKGRGAPPKEERNSKILRLHGLGWEPSEIARETEPDFDDDRRKATGRVYLQLKRMLATKTGESHDEPKALLDDRSSEGSGRAPGDAAVLGQNREDLGPAHSAPSQQGREALDGRPEEPDPGTER